MKKFILLFMLIPFLGISQNSAFIVKPKAGMVVSGLNFASYPVKDTAFYFTFMDNGTGEQPTSWSAHAKWIDVDTTGAIALKVTDFNMTDWLIYNDSLSFTIADTTGSDGIEDAMWNWRFGGFFLDFDDTVSQGQLWINIIFNSE